MIQIEAWAIAGVLVLFLLAIAFLSYFIISKKLFPQVIEFGQEINPNEGRTVSEIAGYGIIKKIEIRMQNVNSIINITVDQTNFLIFSLSNNKNSGYNVKENTLGAQIQLFERFNKNFSVYFQNQSDITLFSSGSIHFEIRKPLGITIKTILAEIRR
ncbi:MAG: hypothetical protein ABSD42_08500 [Candidatus Bathyarchaeia archaeon]